MEGESPVWSHASHGVLIEFTYFRVAYFGNCAQSVGYISDKTKYDISTDSEEVL